MPVQMAEASAKERIRLRVFELSAGPDRAKVIHVDPHHSLAHYLPTIRRALYLPAEPEARWRLYTTRQKRLDPVPLELHTTIEDLGLADNGVLILRRRTEASTSVPQKARTPVVHAVLDSTSKSLPLTALCVQHSDLSRSAVSCEPGSEEVTTVFHGPPLTPLLPDEASVDSDDDDGGVVAQHGGKRSTQWYREAASEKWETERRGEAVEGGASEVQAPASAPPSYAVRLTRPTACVPPEKLMTPSPGQVHNGERKGALSSATTALPSLPDAARVRTSASASTVEAGVSVGAVPAYAAATAASFRSAALEAVWDVLNTRYCGSPLAQEVCLTTDAVREAGKRLLEQPRKAPSHAQRTAALRELHVELITHALQCRPTPPHITADVVLQRFGDNLPALYSALLHRADLHPAPHTLRVVSALLATHAPSLLPAREVVSVLYEGREAEYVEQVLARVEGVQPSHWTWLEVHCGEPNECTTLFLSCQTRVAQQRRPSSLHGVPLPVIVLPSGGVHCPRLQLRAARCEDCSSTGMAVQLAELAAQQAGPAQSTDDVLNALLDTVTLRENFFSLLSSSALV